MSVSIKLTISVFTFLRRLLEGDAALAWVVCVSIATAAIVKAAGTSRCDTVS